jgi:hypothetical protein
MSTKGDPRLLAEEVTKRGEVFRGRRVGRGSYFTLFLAFVLLSSSYPMDLGSKGASSPRPLAVVRAAHLSHLLCFHACCLSLSARLASHLTTSSGKVTPRGALRAYPRSCIYALGKQKLTQSDKNKLELLHPGTDDPSP